NHTLSWCVSMPDSRGSESPCIRSGGFMRPDIGQPALLMLLGARLRRLREDSCRTRPEAAAAIRVSEIKIARLESGRAAIKRRDLADLLDLYGVRDATERTTLMALAAQANTPAWWQAYPDVVPDWFEDFLGLEQGARVIRTWEVQFVPGLLQTEDYA